MVSLPDDLWARPEVAELTDAAFRAFVAGWCYAHQHRTDGYLPAGALRVLGAAPRVVRELAAGVWEAQGDGSYRIVAYLESNSTRAEEEAAEAAQREQRRQAGLASGEARRRTAEERAVERLVERQANGPLNGSLNGSFNGEGTARSVSFEPNAQFRSTARSTARSNGYGAGAQTARIPTRENSSPSSSSPPSPSASPSATASAPDILAGLDHADREAIELGRKAIVSGFNRARIPCPRVLWGDIERRIAGGWSVEEFEEAIETAARKGGRSFDYVCEVVSTRRLEAARQRIAAGEYEYEYGASAAPEQRQENASEGSGSLPWDGDEPEPVVIAGRPPERRLTVVRDEPETPESGPFDGMPVEQREAMHEYVLGWERYALEDDGAVADIRQFVEEFSPAEVRWAKQEANRRVPRIWPPYPARLRQLLAERGVEPTATEPGPGARDVYLASPEEWRDWGEWEAPERVRNTWADAIRNLGDDPALALAYDSVIRQARLVCGRWPEWVVAVPGSALGTMERLRTTVLRALCEAGGSTDMGLRIVREREPRALRGGRV